MIFYLNGIDFVDTDIHSQESRVIIDASKDFLLEALLLQFSKNHDTSHVCRLFSMLVDLKTLAHRSIREDRQWIIDHRDMKFPDHMYDILGIPLSSQHHRDYTRLQKIGSPSWRRMFTAPEMMVENE